MTLLVRPSSADLNGKEPSDIGSSLCSRPKGSMTVHHVLRSPADVFNLNPFQGNRVITLFDPATPLPEAESIALKAHATDGADFSVRVSVVKLNKKDSTIHPQPCC